MCKFPGSENLIKARFSKKWVTHAVCAPWVKVGLKTERENLPERVVANPYRRDPKLVTYLVEDLKCKLRLGARKPQILFIFLLQLSVYLIQDPVFTCLSTM